MTGSRFVLPLHSARDLGSLRRLDWAHASERLPLHARGTFDGTRSTVPQPLAGSREQRRARSGATSLLDLFFATAAPTAALAHAKEGQILPVLVRRLGAYAVMARRERGSEEFGRLE